MSVLFHFTCRERTHNNNNNNNTASTHLACQMKTRFIQFLQRKVHIGTYWDSQTHWRYKTWKITFLSSELLALAVVHSCVAFLFPSTVFVVVFVFNLTFHCDSDAVKFHTIIGSWLWPFYLSCIFSMVVLRLAIMIWRYKHTLYGREEKMKIYVQSIIEALENI